jgi:hypothetical protein
MKIENTKQNLHGFHGLHVGTNKGLDTNQEFIF